MPFSSEVRDWSKPSSWKDRRLTANRYTTKCLPEILLDHDNASSNTAGLTVEFLKQKHIKVIEHPPYSPDLSMAASDERPSEGDAPQRIGEVDLAADDPRCQLEHCTFCDYRVCCQVCCMKGNTRNRWRDGPVCPAVDKELWRLGPDSSAVRSAGCKCLPFLLVKSAREVPAFRFFPEKDKEEVSSVFTCNVKNLSESEDYNEESVKSLLEGILKERQEARELKERQEARELKERQETREYELERLRLSNATETVSVSSADLEGQGVNRRVNLKDLVPKFDAKNADINLFFEIFERQVIKEKVAEDRWVSQLIPLLPIEIAEIVAKEPLEKSDDYPHIKKSTLGPVPTHTDSP
ncbi:uncharacterized protein TNCV_1090841 [Trichonephila clavipes]|uniref:Uncharacterized protein n=1 Tax=Trichonephila clavipes TaxID=2585209 RepID=A0A8X6STU7_TRICX|nr:uncharacterized protein TNCV_1090841 [Trichonephila clavipes]